jgi:hypothetical protein
MKQNIRLMAIAWAVSALLGASRLAYGEGGPIVSWGGQVVVPQSDLTNLVAVSVARLELRTHRTSLSKQHKVSLFLQ